MNRLRWVVYRGVMWVIIVGGMGWGASHLVAQWLSGNTPTSVSIQTTVTGPTGPVNGVYPITVQLYEGNVDSPEYMVGNPLTFESVRFVGGLVSLVLDIQSMVTQLAFANLRDPYIKLMVNNDAVFVPLYAVPYSIQSRTADMAKRVAASGITGVFSNFLVNNSLMVGPAIKPYFRVSEGQVGINVSNILPAATLDVGGIVNATGYRVDGEEIDVALLWSKTPGNPKSIYYDGGIDGYVGIGLTQPRYMLDVQGTVNASAYTVNNVPLEQYLQGVLAWSQEGGRIYRLGDVGIGVTNPTERLDVAGAIRLGASKNPNTAKAGTIEYRIDSVTGRGDFKGYTGSKWVSLTADQGEGESNALSYWSLTDRLESTAKNGVGVWWDPDQFRLGIGPKTAMDAVLTVQASGQTNLMSVKTNLGQPILLVTNSNVGIATNTPGAAYKLDVNGVVNAKTIYVQGRPLELSMSSDSYWLLENNGRIFYDRGRVGIGTSAPMSLLEINSASGESAISFGRQNTRYFTMGISDQAPDSFIIAVSGNLNVPVFAFKNQNIGIGLSNPQANFHVSGNSGVVIKGTFGQLSGFTESGPGAKLFWFPGKAAFRAGLVRSMVSGTGDYRWDVSQLGDYSVGIGYNPLVSGRYAVSVGGLDNQATGEGAVALGGVSNSATGAYSFAAGYQASAAHPGSFVWADYTPSSNVYFSSTRANQFLVRAVGGVGIGTANTTRAMLTVSNPNRSEYVLGAFGVNQMPVMVVTTSGNVGVGVTDPGTATLAFSSDARFGIGTTQPSASFTVVQPADTSRDFLRLTKEMADGSQSPVLIVNRRGNLGIGLEPDSSASSSTILVAGGVVASEYKMVVSDEGKAKIVDIQPYSSPWADPGKNAGNTSYLLGYVGIGTPEPNNLLELSNRSALADGTSLGLLPRLSFDMDGQDQFVLGLVTPSATPTDYLLGILSGSASQPIVTIADTGLGINIGSLRPSASLHVSGNMRVSRVWVGNPDPLTGINSAVPLVVKGRMDTDELYLNGVKFIPASSPWLQSGSDIYVNRNVGIGVSNPLSALHVAGVIRTDGLWVTNPVTFANRFSLSQLDFLDQQVANQFGKLKVVNGELQYINSAGLVKQISSTLTRGSGNSGFMAYFVNDWTIGMSGIRWDGLTDTLSVSGSMQLARTRAMSGLSSDTTMGFGGVDKGLAIQSALGNEGDANQAQSYALADYLMTVNSTWGSSATPVDLTGIQLKLLNAPGTYVLNGSRVMGLSVDVSGVRLDPAGSGLVYAALFNGGNVGIGTTRPSVALEVVGTVSANYFNLRGGLDVPALQVNAGRVNNPLFVAKYRELAGGVKPRIGIGVSQPELTDYELSVAGAVSVNSLLVSGGLVATTLNIGSNYNLVIDDEGEIGIGTSQPDSQLSVRKTLQSDADATQEGMAGRFDTVIDGAKQAGSVFYYDRDINGLLVTLSSGTGSNLSSKGVGLNIDLTQLALASSFDQAKAYGLYVDVTGSGNRVAGAFMGGNVGIGTTEPSALLDVRGAIKATNLLISGRLDATNASVTVNQLSVLDAMDLRGSLVVDSMVVNRELTVNQLVLTGGLTASSMTANALRVTTLTVTHNLTLTGTLIGDTASMNSIRVGSLTVGGGTASGALVVSGNTVLDRLTVLDGLSVLSGTLNINANQLVALPLGNIGIGTSAPSSRLHVVAPSLGAYVPSNPQTWAPLVIQSTGGPGTAAGMLFSTDVTGSGVAPDSGAGLAAVRGSGIGADTGTSLVFLTDSGVTGSRPVERVRIASSGGVGIGVTNPEPGVALQVSGSMYVTSTLVSNTLSVKQVGPPEDGSVLTISGNRVVFDAPVEFLKGVTVNQGIYLASLDAPIASVTHGLLYVNRSDSDLYFLPPNASNPVNLSSLFIGPPSRIPVLGANGRMSAEAPLSWVGSTQTLQIGSPNQRTDVVLTASFNSSVTGTLPFLSVHSILPDYTGGTGVSVIGTQITMQGEGALALGPNDVAVGLSVDVSGLAASRVSNGASSMGRKYAATFMGGHVGIGLTDPQAMLHVKQTGDLPLMRLDSATDSTRFISVSSMGQWGMNTANATALLAIQAPDAWTRPLVWVGGSGGTYWVVTANGNVGIGMSDPQVKLDVQGSVRATSGRFDGVSTNRLTVGSGFVVSGNGFVGIGTTNPTALLSVARSISSAQFNPGDANNYLGQSFSLMRLLFELRDNTPGTTRSYRGNVRGLDIVLDSGTATFGSTQQATSVVGLSLDATQLRATDQSVPVTGLQVDVSGSGGTRYAALLMGGNVGIGTLTPGVLLDVSGDIRAQGLQLTGAVSANAVTVNQLTVNTDMIVGGSISTNILIADRVQTNQLVLTTQVRSASASFVTLNAQVGVIKKLLVGSSVQNPGLADLVVSGDMWVEGGLTVNALSTSVIVAPVGLTITGSGTLIVPTLSVLGRVSVTGSVGLLNQTADPVDSLPLLYAKNNRLWFRPPGLDNSPIDLQSFSSGSPGRLAYFSSSGTLASLEGVSWQSETQRLSIAGGLSLLATPNATGDFTGALFSLPVADRRLGSSGQLVGLAIDMVSDSNGGRLAQNDVAIGLKVDVSALQDLQTDVSGNTRRATKLAAAFMGGSVGIGTTQPQAALHVSPNFGVPGLLVGASRDEAHLMVDAQGRVGIGSGMPSASLTVVARAGLAHVLWLQNSAGMPVWVVGNNQRVGIGKSDPTVALDVAGSVVAESALFDQVSVNRLVLGGELGVVVSDNRMALGGWQPGAALSISSNMTLLGSNPSTLLDISRTIYGASVPGITYQYGGGLTGIQLTMTNQNATPFSGTANGLVIDMGALSSARAVTGLSVQVGASQVAAYFGGAVGVGTTPNEGVSLQVSGNATVGSLVVLGAVTANRLVAPNLIGTVATINYVRVLTDILANRVSVDTLVVSTLNVNSVQYQYATVNALTVKNMGVNTNPTLGWALDVVGPTQLTGAVEIIGTVSANQLVPQSGNTITFNSSLVAFESSRLAATQLSAEQYILMPTQNNAPELGSLWVSSNSHLYFKSDSTVYPLTESIKRTPIQVAYYGADGFLTSSSGFGFDGSTLSLGETGGAATSGKLRVDATVSSNQTEYTAHRVNVAISDRTGSSGAVNVKGLAIDFGPSPGTTTARLKAGEVATGLWVDLRNVYGEYTQTAAQGVGAARAYKSAALFMGGSVGIGTTEPQALLDVVAQNEVPFQVKKDNTVLLVVSSNGNVGVGTSLPTARLTVEGATVEGASDLLSVSDGTQTPSTLLAVKMIEGTLRVGVGTANPLATLHVATVNGLPSLLIGGASKPFVVVSGNMVGMGGVPSPTATLHVSGDIRVDSGGVTTLALKNGKMGVGIGDPQADLHVTTNVLIGQFTTPSNISPSFKGLTMRSGMTSEFRMGFDGQTPEIKTSATELLLKASGSTVATFDSRGLVLGGGRGTSDALLYLQHPSQVLLEATGLANVVMKVLGDHVQIGSSARGTGNTSTRLYVGGTMTVTGNIQVINTVTANSFSAQGLSLTKTVTNNVLDNLIVNQHEVKLDQDLGTGSITGLKVSLASNRNSLLDRGYSLWNGGTGIGLYVDVASLTTTGVDTISNRYAALFSGGRVGIGTTQPASPLDVRGSDTDKKGLANPYGVTTVEVVDLLHMRSADGVGLKVRSVPQDDATHWMVYNRAGQDPYSVLTMRVDPTTTKPFIGIGIDPFRIDTLDKPLVVNGDMRLGVVSTTTPSGAGAAAGPGNQLLLSGGPVFSSGLGSENGSELSLYRYNAGSGKSELRMGWRPLASTAVASLAIGSGDDATFKPYLTVASGSVVISDGAGTNTTPIGRLTVYAERPAVSGTLVEQHGVLFHNTGGNASAHVLGLRAEPPSSGTKEVSFISFFGKGSGGIDKRYGVISGTYVDSTMTGVKFLTTAADYAEYIQKAVSSDRFVVGDVLGVTNGLVSHRTDTAQVVLVRSYAATVAGNMPPSGQEDQYELVAFLGQVKVRVRGPVSAGEWVVASGLNDGTAVAVAGQALTPAMLPLIVGIAWESNQDPNEKLVLAAVGGPFSTPSAAIGQWVQDAQQSLTEAKRAQATLESEVLRRLESMEAKIRPASLR